mmetsp:Transcript_7218/g.20021  ORF Transcript_7218/g.20021 Transcript_7218/m.20021 type:complete len:216 (-) Transcript_7218:618-1265(-)
MPLNVGADKECASTSVPTAKGDGPDAASGTSPSGLLLSITFRLSGFKAFSPCGSLKSTRTRSPCGPSMRPRRPLNVGLDKECASTRAPAGNGFSNCWALLIRARISLPHSAPATRLTLLCPAVGQRRSFLSTLAHRSWHCTPWAMGTISSWSPCITRVGHETAASLPRVSKGSLSAGKSAAASLPRTCGASIATIGSCLTDMSPESTIRPYTSAA